MGDQKYKSDLKRRVYKFSVSVIEFVQSLNKTGVFYSIIDQLLRSSTSVGANIIEAKAASSKKDFIKYYEIALKSSHETRYWLFLIRDGLKITSDDLANLIKENEELSKIIASCILSLKTKKTV